MNRRSSALARSARAALYLCILVPLLIIASGSADHGARVLWVNADRSVFKISPVDGSPELELASLPDIQALAVDETDDHVWVYSHKHLWAYDSQGNQLVNEALPHDFHGGEPSGMVADGTAGDLWIGIHRKLYLFNLSGTLQATVDLDHGIEGLTLDSARSHLWIAERDQLVVLDKTGSTLFTVPLDRPADVLAYDSDLDQVWVVSGRTVTRYDANGNQSFTAKVRGDIDDRIAPDGQGNLWAAGDGTLSYLDQSGSVAFTLTPFAGDPEQNGDIDGIHHIVDLVADPLNHTAWVANGRYLEQYATDGTLKQAVDIQSFTGSNSCSDQNTSHNAVQGHHHDGNGDCGDHHGRWSDFWHGRPGIRHVALYVDTVPPTVSITSPTNDLYTNKPQLPIALTYSDVGSGVDPASVRVTNDGVNIPVNCQPNAGNSGTTCTPASPLPDGQYDLEVTVADYAGNLSKPASVYFTVDTIPPTITLTSPKNPADVDQPDVTIAGSLSEAGTLTINGTNAPLSATFAFSDPVTLVRGSNAFTLVATDLAGNVTTLTENLVYNSVPAAPNNNLIKIADPVNGEAAVTGGTGAVGGGDNVIITNMRTGQSVTVTANADGSFSGSIAAQWGDPIALTAEDPTDPDEQSTPTQNQAGSLPPSPAAVAPQLTPNGETPFFQATDFLYTGSNPVQIGVATNTIQPYRVAVIRGQVEGTNANALSGVVISALDHPEFGYTVSRADGSFDLAVNGGQSYTLEYQKSGYLLVERNVKTPVRDYAFAPTVALTQPSAQATVVMFGSAAPAQFVMSTPVTDTDGTRQVGIFIPAGTEATMNLPDGTQAPLTAAHLRITEYTVGPQGQAAMPAQLPEYSTYTYAVDYQLDEAEAQRAQKVGFSKTVYAYVNNFLNFPVGAVVPSGWYDQQLTQWVPSANGQVIEILGVNSAGEAEIDVDGSGQPADVATLASLGFTTTELVFLAEHYSVGTILWRVPASHFCAYDYNPYGVHANSAGLSGGAPYRPATSNTNPCKPGCIVGALHQTLGESIPLTGIGATLDYDSASALPNAARARTLVIPLTGASNQYYQGLQTVQLEVDVAGQQFIKDFPPEPNQTYTFVWNGLDGYGRPVYGSVPAEVTVRYLTDINYVFFHPQATGPWATDDAFDLPNWLSGGAVTVARNSQTVTVGNEFPPITLTNSPTGQGVAMGWDLSSDGWYDFVAGVQHFGNGSTRNIGTSSPVIVPVALTSSGYETAAVGADGTAYASSGGTIYRVPVGSNSAQVFATLPASATIGALRVGPDGTLYVLDTHAGQIDSISVSGAVSTVASNMQDARSFAVLAAGGFVVSEGTGYIVKVATDGTAAAIAGIGCPQGGVCGDSGDGGYALRAAINPYDIAVDQFGDIYFVQETNVAGVAVGSIRSINLDGVIYTLVGSATGTPVTPSVGQTLAGVALPPLSGLAVDEDGGMYVTAGGVIYLINASGVLVATAGGGTLAPSSLPGLGSAAATVHLSAVDLALSPYGTLYIADSGSGLMTLSKFLPTDYGTEYTIPSSDGTLIYDFDGYGRLLQVVNSLNGTVLQTSSYDASGNLMGVTDAFGRTTTINRDAYGHATSIVSPDGQATALTVDANDDLTSISDPAGDTWSMGYGSGGLLTTLTDPRGETEQYSYDPTGLLTQVKEPNGGGWQINRVDSGPSSYSVTLTSGAGRVTQYRWNPGSFVCGMGFDGWATTCFQSAMQTIAPDGTITSEKDPLWANSQTVLDPDGTVTTESSTPDPRFGMTSPLPQAQIELNEAVTPLTDNIGIQRQVTLGSGGTLDVTALTQTTDINGQNYTDSYNGSNQMWTSTTPAGRSVATQINAIGQPLQTTIPGLAPLAYAYDSAGRLTTLTQGTGAQSRATSFDYYPNGPSQGFLESVTDPLGRTLSYAYDLAGRVTSEKLPDSEQIQFGYDADGNLTSVTPPGRPAHAFDYTQVNDVENYIPPTVSGVIDTATHYSYNVDRQLTGIALPDGDNVSLVYDTGGRLSTITLPTGAYQYSYTSGTGQLSSITSPDSENLAYSWDGFLNTRDTWSGPVSGSLTRQYDDNFRVTSLTLSAGGIGGSSIAYSYDADGLVTGISGGTQLSGENLPAMSITHDPQNGLITGTSLGDLVSTVQYDSFGEPSNESFGNPVAQLNVQASASPASVTNSALLVTGTLPSGDTLVIADALSAISESYPASSSGQVSGTFALQSGSNDMTLDVEDGNGNILGSTQATVAYSAPLPTGYQINALEGVDGGGDLYFGQTNSAAGTPVQYELAAGLGTPTQPAALQTAVQLAPAPDGSVYFVDSSNVLWHEVSGQSTQIADLSSKVNTVNSLTVTPAGGVYFSSNSDIYNVSSSGAISMVGALSGCSGVPLAAVRAAVISPYIIALGQVITLHSSAYGLTGGCQGSTGETVYLINSDGSSSVLASNTTTYQQYALSPSGEVCFIDGSGDGIDCQNPDGSTQNFAPNTGILDLENGPTGQLYYLGNDATVSGDQNIYLVSGQSATALLTDQNAAPPVQGTLTVTAASNTSTLFSENYTRDNAGRITQKTETVNGVTTIWGYGYDQEGRLDSVSEGGAVIDTYGYDSNGNQVSVNGHTIATYDDQDRLLTYGSNSYTYDANGDRTSMTTPGGTVNYTYDALGNLTDVTIRGKQIHYIYDGQNRRIGKEVNGTLTEGFLYDGQINPVAEVDATGQIVEQFVYGTRPNVPDYIITAGQVYRVMSNQLGSPVLIVNASTGAIAEQISYDAWGNITSDSNPGFQPFGFAGGLYDSDTGLVHFGTRDYDPQTGRWISKDPMLFAGGETSLYGYTGSDPINFIDPSGLYPYSLGQLAAIIFNETQSLSGTGIDTARLYLAYVALNRPNLGGVAPDFLTAMDLAEIRSGNPAAIAVYRSSVTAAACALNYPQNNPIPGVLGFNLRSTNSKAPRHGSPDIANFGPFNNSYPTIGNPNIPPLEQLPATGVYANFYTH